VLDKINASLIPLLFKPFVKFDIAYSPPPLGDICVLSPVRAMGKDARGKLGIQMMYLKSAFTNSKPIVKIIYLA
jgi:hypothetical protein